MLSVYFCSLACRAGWLALSVAAAPAAVVCTVCGVTHVFSLLLVRCCFVLCRDPKHARLTAELHAGNVRQDLKSANFSRYSTSVRYYQILTVISWEHWKWLSVTNRGRVRFRSVLHHMREQIRWHRGVPSVLVRMDVRYIAIIFLSHLQFTRMASAMVKDDIAPSLVLLVILIPSI